MSERAKLVLLVAGCWVLVWIVAPIVAFTVIEWLGGPPAWPTR
jgi:hypothetical protein